MKKLLIIFSGIVLFVLLAITAFVATFDANNYKAQIVEQVEQQTGRDFKIDGDINISVFPWVGLKVEDMALGNARGFSDRAFAQINQLDVKVMVLPLLTKEVHVDKVVLRGVSVSLETDDLGQNNWSDLAQPSVKDAADAGNVNANESVQASAEGGAELAGIVVNGIEFVGANVSWLDARTNTQALISELSLETSAIKFNEPVSVEFKAHVANNQPGVDAEVSLQTNIKFNEALNIFDINDFKLNVQTVMPSMSKELIALNFKADAHVDLDHQAAQLKAIEVSALGIVLSANVNIAQLKSEPRAVGLITTNAFDGRAVAKQLQIELPHMDNANSLSRISFESKIDANPNSVRLDKFKIGLDQSQITGWVHVLDVAQPNVNYNLKMNAINLDGYMAPVSGVSQVENVQENPADVVASVDNADTEIPLPVDLLQTLGLSGIFEIESATLQNIAITDISFKTQAGSGLLRVRPITMNLLNGQIEAGVDLDVRQTPAYTIAVSANKLNAGPIIDPLLKGMAGDEEINIKGAVDLTADIKSQGESLLTLKKAATGDVVFDMNQTSVTGVDIEYFVKNAVIDYLGEKKSAVPSGWRGEYTPKEKTAFKKIHASASVAQGKLKNNDFIMDSKRIKVTGKGEIDIVNNSMDYYTLIDLDLDRKKTFADKVLNEPMGVRIHGPFEKIEKDIDLKRLGETVKDLGAAKVKKEVKKKIEKKKEKAVKKIGDKFKSLFK